jgi:UTP--glucose-1-phosphate uridylyltransferase
MTRANPKEMLPIGGRPMIYYTVLEAALSGLEELYVVVNNQKKALCRYLEGGGLEKDLQEANEGLTPPLITFVDQPVPLGSGEAIYRTREMIGQDPFALMMPDRIFIGSRPSLAQIIPTYERFHQDTLGILPVDAGQAKGFGNVGLLEVGQLDQGIVEIHGFSSKSKDPLVLEEGKTILKFAGRAIFGPHFFTYLEKTRATREEWDDTPAIKAMCQERKVLGKILEGTGFDVGNPIGYSAAHDQFNTQ